MQRRVIAGIDIGGTKIAVALVDVCGTAVRLHRFPTRLSLGPQRVLDDAVEAIEAMAGEDNADICAVGVGCGGPLDRTRGLILSPPNLPGWDVFPVVRILEERLGAPVVLDNDANVAALGEYEYGAGRGFRDVVYVTISTGIGGGVIVDGRLLHGVGDGAGEIGHMVVVPGGPPCGCGARGCLEALCSGTAIARRARERLAAGSHASVLATHGDPNAITAQAVADAARQGDALASEVWDEMIELLATGLGNVMAVLAPEAIILGGGVSAVGDQLIAPVRRRIVERVRILPAERVQILQAALGGDSGIYGALILGRRAYRSPDEAS